MSKLAAAAAVVATCLCVCSRASGQEAPARAASAPSQQPAVVSLDLHQALLRARQAGPVTSLARLRIAEAESRRVDADVFPRENPLLEVGIGPRIVSTDLRSPYFTVGLSQVLDMGGGRTARIRLAEAGVSAARADVDTDTQAALRATAVAFVRALWAGDRAKLAARSVESARSALAAAKKRQQAGESTVLDVNVARAGVARAAAAARASEADREAATGELRLLLGLTSRTHIEPRGSLADPVSKNLTQLQQAARSRPELRALAAELDAAQAQEDLADALAWPDIGVGAVYQFEDRDVHTVYGTLSLTLPIFERAQGMAAEARARRARAERAAAVARTSIEGEVGAAASVLEKRSEAVRAFEEEGGLEAFQENLALAARAYAAGETSLSDLLLVQRELLETEADRLDRLLQLRLSEVDTLAAAGALP